MTDEDKLELEAKRLHLIKAAQKWRNDPDSDRLVLKLIEAVDEYQDKLDALKIKSDPMSAENYRKVCLVCGVTGQCHIKPDHAFVSTENANERRRDCFKTRCSMEHDEC